MLEPEASAFRLIIAIGSWPFWWKSGPVQLRDGLIADFPLGEWRVVYWSRPMGWCFACGNEALDIGTRIWEYHLEER